MTGKKSYSRTEILFILASKRAGYPYSQILKIFTEKFPKHHLHVVGLAGMKYVWFKYKDDPEYNETPDRAWEKESERSKSEYKTLMVDAQKAQERTRKTTGTLQPGSNPSPPSPRPQPHPFPVPPIKARQACRPPKPYPRFTLEALAEIRQRLPDAPVDQHIRAQRSLGVRGRLETDMI